MDFSVTFVTMLQVLHKILAVIIALVILFSTLSFTVEKHVCMGEVTDVSYFTESESCGMTTEECDLDEDSETHIKKDNCCDNVVELIPGIQNEQQAIDGFEFKQIQFIIAYSYSYLNLFETNREFIPFIDYSPPLVDKDIKVLYQNFLI